MRCSGSLLLELDGSILVKLTEQQVFLQPRVAKGYSQVEDFKDTIQVFLSLVNHFDLECDQVDIVAAFLNSDLEETIYMDPPEGSDLPHGEVL